MIARHSVTAVLLLASAGLARADGTSGLEGAAAGATAPAPAPAATATATAPALAPKTRAGLAIGAELGDPISATVAYYHDKMLLAGALGSATLESPGIAAHADAQFVVTQLSPKAAFRVGLGLRYYHHSHLLSPDEVPSSHYGARVSAAIAMNAGPVELYAELAPGIDFKRTNSCSLASGAYSVCPHAQENPLFLQMVVGLRYFLSH
jgi:hypothetical protein